MKPILPKNFKSFCSTNYIQESIVAICMTSIYSLYFYFLLFYLFATEWKVKWILTTYIYIISVSFKIFMYIKRKSERNRVYKNPSRLFNWTLRKYTCLECELSRRQDNDDDDGDDYDETIKTSQTMQITLISIYIPRIYKT